LLNRELFLLYQRKGVSNNEKNQLFFFIIIIILLLLTLFSCEEEKNKQSTDQQELLIQELNQWLIPVENSPLNLTDVELMNFLSYPANAKIVALGEATHGTKEFFQMKHRIFKYLVEYCNHKAFGFEADFAESLYFDDYICGKDVDLDWLMKTKMHFWTWRTEEVKQLFEWMKSYNSTRSDNEKIHYYGFDCQFTTYQSEFIQEYLDRTLPSLWDSIASILNQVKKFSDSNYDTMDEATYLDIKTKLESVEDQFEENKNTLIANSSSTEYEINKQLLITFKQAFICKVGKYSSQTRDMFMAENALWISNFLGKNAKITLWAHNYHISTFYAWMGYYVGANLGNMYKAVGFSFSQGSFTAFGPDRGPLGIYEITTKPPSSSVNFIFHHASHPNFAFHIEAIPPGSEWDKWLGSQRPFLMIGALFSGEVLQYYKPFNIKAFDWIIHFDQTTASSLIPLN
jgi:erythromycin esterase